MTRREKHELVVELRAQGLTWGQIGERLGLKKSTIGSLFSDPDGSKDRERKRRYQGSCIECGGPTHGGDGRERAPRRCLWCVRGVPRPRSGVRFTVPVRLDEIPFEVRMAAASEAARSERDPEERMELFKAALWPSSRTFWLAENARADVERLLSAERMAA